MKVIFNIGILSLCCVASLWAEERAKIGYLRVINAIGLSNEPVSFSINGKAIFAGGYRLGQSSGAFPVAVNDGMELEVKPQGYAAVRTRMDMKPNEVLTVVALAKKVPMADENSSAKWEIKLLRLKQMKREPGYQLTLVSVCSRASVDVGLLTTRRRRTEWITANELIPTTVQLGSKRVDVDLLISEKENYHLSPDGPGHSVVIIYERPEGRLEMLHYEDISYEIAG
jgi:hypothetical protein